MKPLLPWAAMAALFCAVVAALLNIRGADAQHNTDDASLINVTSLTQLDAIRWDLDGNGEADNPDEHIDPDDDTSATQGDTYAAAFPSVTCPTDGCTGYELMNDLNFSGSKWASGDGWEPIGIYTGTGGSPYGSPFAAIFEGNGHSISNLFIDREDEDGIGLFGNFGAHPGTGHEIRNLELRNVDVTGGENVGGLVGYFGAGSITDSSVAGGSVTGDEEVGGLVGSSGGPIANSSSAATVSGESQTGGLVGHNFDPITDSYATGNVSGEDDIGGLVGRNDDDITNSYATGDVTGTADDGGSSIGGLVGTHWYDSSTISGSHATGDVTGHNFIGGLVGLVWGGNIQTSYATGHVTGESIQTTHESDGETFVTVDPSGRIGGLVGSNRGATISTSFATGHVAGMHHVGGLVGENTGNTIRATYAWGDVTATGSAEGFSCQSDRDPGCRIGGLVGTNINGGAIINSYSIGRLIIQANHQRVGGLAGESPTERLHGNTGYVDPGSITVSYWDTETSEMVVGVGTDDENNNREIDERNFDVRPIVFGETEQDGIDGKTTSELQTPTGYTGIYDTWDDSPDLDLDGDSSTGDANGKDAPWYFGTASDYPVLKIDMDRDGDIDQDDYDDQVPGPKTPRVTSVSVKGITQTGGTVTVRVAHPNGSTVYIRYKASTAGSWRSANKAASTGTVTFELSGLTAGQSYEVQASFDSSFPSGATKTFNFNTDPPGPSVTGVSVGDIEQTEAMATVTVANANGSTVYLRHKATEDASFGTPQEAAVSTGTTSLTFDLTGLTAGLPYEVQASFDNTFPPTATESDEFDTLPPDPSVSGVSAGDITHAGATVTVTVAHPNGSTVYLRHKASTESNFGTAQEAAASSESVNFTLSGLTAEVLYDLEASFDGSFQTDVSTASFRTKQAPSVSGVAMSNISQTGATATVTVANPNGSNVYLRHKAATDADFGTPQEATAAADAETVAFTLSGLTAGQSYEVQASFDSTFQTGVQATAFSTTSAPSLSRISMSNVMQTVATATVTVVDPDGSTVYLRHKSATDANFGTAQESAASTATVSFTLTGLSAGLSYEVQASFDSSFQTGVRSTTFSTPPAASVTRVEMSNVTQTGATATVTVADPDGSKVYLRHKAATDNNFGTAQEAAAGTATVSFNLSGLTAGLSYEVQASFDSNFQSGVQATTFSTTPAPSVSRVTMSNITQTGATATVTVANADGSTVYLRHKSATDSNFGTAQESAASTATVSFTLSGLTAGLAHEVQASFDNRFQSGVRSTTFSTLPQGSAVGVSGISMSNITQTGATATVTVANPDGSTVYLRHKAATDENFGTAQNATASAATVAFTLSGLTAGQSYEVQASFDSNFGSGVQVTTFRTTLAASVSRVAVSGVTQTGATATVTIANPDSSTVYLRHKAATAVVWSSNQSDTASTGTVSFTLSGLSAGLSYEVQASFDSNFESGVQATTFSTTPAATVARISMYNVTQTGATATVTINNPDGRTVYLRHKATTEANFGTAQDDTASTGTVTFTLSGLSAGQSYEVQASFDSTFQLGVQATAFVTIPDASVSGISMSNITQTGATATVAVAHPDGGTLYLRHKAASDVSFGTAQEAAADAETVAFTLSGLSLGTSYEVQASFDSNFQSGVQSTTFSTSPAPSVSRIDITDITETGAKATVTIAYPDGSTVYMRHKAAADASFGTPVEATGDAQKVSFTLTGLTLRVTYEVQASLDQSFLPGTFVSTTFTTSKPSKPPGGGGDSVSGSSDGGGSGGGSESEGAEPPDLAVGLSVDGEPIPVGQMVNFTVTITNNTDALMTGLRWRDVAFNGAWQSLSDLAAGASVTVTGSFGPVQQTHLPGIILTVAADSDQTAERPASRYVNLTEAPAEEQTEQTGQTQQLVLPPVPYATLSTLWLRVDRVQYTVPDVHLAHNIPDLTLTLPDGTEVVCEFLKHYNETGGLTRWGYAISEVFEERPWTLTQYYQKGVVDCHPVVYRNDPWVTERRLAWDYIGGGVDFSPDLGVEPGLLSEQPGVPLWTWGHRVSNYAIDGTEVGFLDFFEALGGIKSFGYPKTDARRDNHPQADLTIPGTDTAIIRQYFQAAVLEYYPNDELQPVKSALLGDLLRDRRFPYQSHLAFKSFKSVFPLRVGEIYQPERAIFPADFIPPGVVS